MKRGIIIILSLALFLLVSCTPTEQPPASQPDTEVKEDTDTATKPDTTEEPEETEPTEEVQPKYEEEVAELLEKSKDRTTYTYSFKSRIRNKYEAYDEVSYEVYIKNNKIKKVHSDIKKIGTDIVYNEVYLDINEKTAFGTCALSGVSCQDNKNIAYKLDYDSEKLSITPLEVIQNVGYDAKIVGEEMFDNRKTIILENTNSEGKNERLYIDNFYGLPLKQVIYDYEDDEEIVLEQNTFTSLSASVKNSDVNLPEDYTIEE